MAGTKKGGENTSKKRWTMSSSLQHETKKNELPPCTALLSSRLITVGHLLSHQMLIPLCCLRPEPGTLPRSEVWPPQPSIVSLSPRLCVCHLSYNGHFSWSSTVTGHVQCTRARLNSHELAEHKNPLWVK